MLTEGDLVQLMTASWPEVLEVLERERQDTVECGRYLCETCWDAMTDGVVLVAGRQQAQCAQCRKKGKK